MAKFIKVPAPITLTNPLGQVFTQPDGTPIVLTFKQFVQERTMDGALTAGKTGFSAAILQSEAIESVKAIPEPGDFWELKSYEQWEALVRTVKEPKQDFDPRFAFALVPFMQAIVEAADSKLLPEG